MTEFKPSDQSFKKRFPVTEEEKEQAKQVVKKLPKRWDKLENMAMTAVRLSQKGMPPENRRYQVVNLHDYAAQLFLLTTVPSLGIDLNFQRRELDLRIEALCLKFKWADRRVAMRYANDAWEHVRDAGDQRMFLRKHQEVEEPKQFIDKYLENWK
jgi:hypothetical protein